MALTKLVKINENSFWAVWKIEEPFSQLYNSLQLSPQELKNMESTVHHPKKKLEWMAGRLALQSLLIQVDNPEWEITKDNHGKPHLVDQSFQISLANCYPFATAIVHKMKPVGIDIEFLSEKLLRVRHKFLNETEFFKAGTNLDLLCIFWCAKECIYKIHGRKMLSFKDHIFIKDFNLASGTLSAHVVAPTCHSQHELAFEQIENFYIAYSY